MPETPKRCSRTLGLIAERVTPFGPLSIAALAARVASRLLGRVAINGIPDLLHAVADADALALICLQVCA